jgi:5-methyltetrahydrofolate--homocysteine methyltransferase
MKMKKIDGLTFMEHIGKGIVILDGASGTTLHKKGLQPGDCPEQWACAHPKEVITMQQDYIEAGSMAVYSFTLGGSPIKLSEYGVTDVYGINKKLAEISAEAAKNKAFVGGDVGSTGLFIAPLGELSFDQALDAFKQQIRGLADGGSDFIIIETMIDLAEARAALIAAKETCDLPVAVSMSFDENGRTLTGASPESAALALIASGADIIGVNCSTGPQSMVKVVEAMKRVSNVPVIVKPNAGLPRIENGETVFSMQALEFAQYVRPLVSAGANLLGGCCGTDKEFIRLAAQEAKDLQSIQPLAKKVNAVSCAGGWLSLEPSVSAGTGLDATKNPAFAALLNNGDYEGIYDIVLDEQDKGAQILVLCAAGAADEAEALVKSAEVAAFNLKMPVAVKSENPDAIEAFLRQYTGRAIVDPQGAGQAQAAIYACARKYGAYVMIREDMLEQVLASGLLPEDIVVMIDSGEEALLNIRRFAQRGIVCAQVALPENDDYLELAKNAGLNIIFGN